MLTETADGALGFFVIFPGIENAEIISYWEKYFFLQEMLICIGILTCEVVISM